MMFTKEKIQTLDICQAKLDTLDGAWIAADSFGLILCANAPARQWLNNNISISEQRAKSSFIYQLSSRQSDFGLLPLKDKMLVGFSSECPWREHTTLINLISTNLSEMTIGCNNRLLKLFTEALRDPVSKLDLFTYLYTHGRQEKQEFYKETLAKETGRMVLFIENLSLIAQLMAGSGEKLAPLSQHELRQALESCLESFTAEAGGDFEITLSNSGDSMLANPGLLCRVIRNMLMSVYRNESKENHISIHIEQDGSWIRIRIDEPGFYIHKDNFAQIFEPFENGKLDLELVVIRSIMRLHGGYITARLVDGLMFIDFWIPPALENSDQVISHRELILEELVH